MREPSRARRLSAAGPGPDRRGRSGHRDHEDHCRTVASAYPPPVQRPGASPRNPGSGPYDRVVASLAEIVRQQSRLTLAEIVHLQRLVASWNMLADFCFSDLLLFVPLSDGASPVDDADGKSEFLLVGHVRPSTTQTLYRLDMIGETVNEADRPLVDRKSTRLNSSH